VGTTRHGMLARASRHAHHFKTSCRDPTHDVDITRGVRAGSWNWLAIATFDDL
jgi:hypothetical protein